MSQPQIMKNELTPEEFKIVAHTLGIDPMYAKRSKKAKDKKLPEEFYRNYFCASVNHNDYPVLDSLMRDGIMESWERFKNLYFGVTEWGEFVFRKEFNKYLEITKQ